MFVRYLCVLLLFSGFTASVCAMDADILFGQIINQPSKNQATPKTDNMTEFYTQQIEKWGFRWSPNLPDNRTKLYHIDKNWQNLGNNTINYFKNITGKETIFKGYQRQGIQYIKAFFKFNQKHPYCYWFVRVKDGMSHGRCDRDNNGLYEHDFNNIRKNTMKLKKWNWKKYWKGESNETQ